MSDFNWTCPHCERDVTISPSRCSVSLHVLNIENTDGRRTLFSRFIVCPNPNCKKFTLTASLHESELQLNRNKETLYKKLNLWNLIPSSKAKTFPTYIPQPILDDYLEACLIQDLSPKASATLSRRCLQGILRDFWKVKPENLAGEINQIEASVDPATWDAITAVRKLGNIGAHMEKDINVIVEVDPTEAGLLIELIETLLREWYVAREDRKVRMNAIIEASNAKKATN